MNPSYRIPIKPIQKQSVPEEIIHELQKLIDDGHFKPGSKLPPERKFAKLLNVSRPSLREALRFLSLIGILENRHGSGTYLATSKTHPPIEPFSIILSIKKGFIVEIFEARESLEGTAAELAAQRSTSEDFANMEKSLEAMKSNLEDPEKYSQAELEFHQAIIHAAKNRVIEDLMEKVYRLLVNARDLVRRYSSESKSYLINDLKNHNDIYKYIKNGDKRMARNKMIEHMQIIKKLILE